VDNIRQGTCAGVHATKLHRQRAPTGVVPLPSASMVFDDTSGCLAQNLELFQMRSRSIKLPAGQRQRIVDSVTISAGQARVAF
jgi:hypothetical protein